jgi:hypothetical protein
MQGKKLVPPFDIPLLLVEMVQDSPHDFHCENKK